MKSPFQLLLHHRNNNQDDPESTTTNVRPLSKIKSLPGRGSSRLPSTSAGTTASQSSSTQHSSDGARGRGHQQRSTTRSSSDTRQDDDHGSSGNQSHSSSRPSLATTHAWAKPKSFRIISYQGSDSKTHYPPARRHANTKTMGRSNQTVNSLQENEEEDDTSQASSSLMDRAKERSSSSSRRMMVRTTHGHDELAQTCLVVGAAVDTCMDEDAGYIVGDALATYACGYDDDDDDDDDDDVDDNAQEQRNDSPTTTTYDAFYQFAKGLASSMELFPHHPVKETARNQEALLLPQPSQPETKLHSTSPEVRDDVPPSDNIHRQLLQSEENSATTSSDASTVPPVASSIIIATEAGTRSDDCTGTSTQNTSQDEHGQQLVLDRGEQNCFINAESLLQAFAFVACQELEWSQDQESLATSQATKLPLTSDTQPVTVANSSHHHESSKESSLSTEPKLEQEILSPTMAQPVPTDKREKKDIFSRRGRFGIGGRRKTDGKVEPKTLRLNDKKVRINSSERTSTGMGQGMDLEPGKIKTTSSAIVTTLATTIEECASC